MSETGSNTMPPVIECRDLTKTFGQFTAVNAINLDVEPGSVVGFLGPNGAGKSTTIRMLMGLSIPSGGEARVLGADPFREPSVRSRIGYVPGELRLDDRLTVAATLESWARLRGNVDPQFRAALTERLDVDPSKRVASLSTGNRRKVALLGALMARPELLILDEPTNGLDPLIHNEVMALLSEASQRGATIFLSSHVLSEVERIADTAVVIRDGKIVANGPISTLRRGAAQEFRAVFSGESPTTTIFSTLPGTQSIDSPHANELRIMWAGPPRELLALLGRYELISLTAPEPDLETAFLSFYQGGDTQ